MPIVPKPQNEKTIAAAKYENSRKNLILVVVFTVVNLALLLFKSNTMFLFSATVPYFVAALGVATEASPIMIIAMTFAVICLVAYFVCWLLSKKHYAWLIVALIMFTADTAFMALLYIIMKDFSGIADVIFHAWVLYYLVVGVINGVKLKKLPDESTVSAAPDPNAEPIADTVPLRLVDEAEKARTWADYELDGHAISLRSTKKMYQLVIDNYVYAEMAMNLIYTNNLCAYLSGHTVEAGVIFGTARHYISIDGSIVSEKVRHI